MEFLIRFTQVHETFRLAEIEALAELENIALEILVYSPASPFCVVKLEPRDGAERFIKRSILAKAIYELWGSGCTYAKLHQSVRDRSSHLWHLYNEASFKFGVDSFQGTRTMQDQKVLIEEFSYVGFEGPIKMRNPDQEFCIFEEWPAGAAALGILEPQATYLGRFIANGERDAISKYDLKKRNYISTTSMDSELALVTANITLAAPGKLFYDPFVGTGSFPIACAHFGAFAWGSDIDGRSIRGKGKRTLLSNFAQYGLLSYFADTFAADLTNCPIRRARLFDGIVCDPPYGVREGLKVLGSRDQNKGKEPVFQNGEAHHLQEGYIPPKRPYSFLAMLDDILDFAALLLVENGRLSFWIPTSNDKDEEILPPQHPSLEITSVCTQSFNRWSRRLITYKRIPDVAVQGNMFLERKHYVKGISADELNPFRKRYFEGFKS